MAANAPSGPPAEADRWLRNTIVLGVVGLVLISVLLLRLLLPEPGAPTSLETVTVKHAVSCMAFSPDGSLLAVGGGVLRLGGSARPGDTQTSRGQLFLYDVKQQAWRRQDEPPERVSWLAFSGNANWLIYHAGVDTHVRDVRTWETVGVVRGRSGLFSVNIWEPFALLPDGRRLAAHQRNDGSLGIVSLPGGQVRVLRRGGPPGLQVKRWQVEHVAAMQNPNGKQIIEVCEDQAMAQFLLVMDVESAQVGRIALPAGEFYTPVVASGCLADGTAWVCRGRDVHVCDLARQKVLRTHTVPREWSLVGGLTAADGRGVILCHLEGERDRTGYMSQWDVATWTRRWKARMGGGLFAVSGDGLIATAEENAVTLWKNRQGP